MALEEDLGGERWLVAEVADLAPEVRLWRMDAGAADGVDEQAADGERLVADDLRPAGGRAGERARSSLRGILSSCSGVVAAELAVGFAR